MNKAAKNHIGVGATASKSIPGLLIKIHRLVFAFKSLKPIRKPNGKSMSISRVSPKRYWLAANTQVRWPNANGHSCDCAQSHVCARRLWFCVIIYRTNRRGSIVQLSENACLRRLAQANLQKRELKIKSVLMIHHLNEGYMPHTN